MGFFQYPSLSAQLAQITSAITIGAPGNTNFHAVNGGLDVTGAVVVLGGLGSDQNSNSAASGSITSSSTTSGFRQWSNAGAKTLHGMVAPSPAYAQLMVHMNTGGNFTIANESGTEATAANRIVTGTGADVVLTTDGAVLFCYDVAAARWRIVGSQA